MIVHDGRGEVEEGRVVAVEGRKVLQWLLGLGLRFLLGLYEVMLGHNMIYELSGLKVRID